MAVTPISVSADAAGIQPVTENRNFRLYNLFDCNYGIRRLHLLELLLLAFDLSLGTGNIRLFVELGATCHS